MKGEKMKDKAHYIKYSITILVGLIICYTALAMNQSQVKTKRPEGTTSFGFLLAVQADADEIAGSSPLKLSLTIKNISKRKGYILETSATEQYHLVVLDDKERPVSLTAYGEKELQPRADHLGQMMRAIEPGEESRDTIEVNKLYHMSSPGIYSITAWRIVYDKEGKEAGTVQSNPIRVRITQ
jgi:hypothetical protein